MTTKHRQLSGTWIEAAIANTDHALDCIYTARGRNGQDNDGARSMMLEAKGSLECALDAIKRACMS